MTTTHGKENGTTRLIDTIEGTEHTSLEAARRFVDSVSDAFPDLGTDGPRRKIIDSAFQMTEQLVDASNQFARKILDVTEKATESGRKAVSSAK